MREQAQMLAKDGKCKVFDAAADGYVRGEGGAAIVVRRLRDAEAALAAAAAAGKTGHKIQHAPQILCVIRSSAVNQDGRSACFTAPNGGAQRSLIT